ncbi:hypothetical protein [Streptomyces sp. NPDC021020]|uniref:hypothetical protein n=1 Tax=Streptomyces sp. NPDC021020 TaxID=3365109 RepID=UPI0037ACA9A4
MPQLPLHSDTEDREGPPPDPRRRRAKALWIAAGVALVALVVVLHLTGVIAESSSSHG